MKNLLNLRITVLLFLTACMSQKASESTKGEVNAESPFAQSKVHLPGLNSDSTVSNPGMTAKEKLALEKAKAAAAAAKIAEDESLKAQLIAQQKAEADLAAQDAASKAAAEKAAADAAVAAELARKTAEQLEIAKKAVEDARIAAELDAKNNLNPEKILLDFVVNDECLINRKKDKESGQFTPEYFVDKHLTEEFYVKASGYFPETAMTLPISKSIGVLEILRLADADSCIVGISEHKEGTALASDTIYTGEENDYRTHLKADDADEFFSQAKGSNVKIAVIDTGADYNNPDLEPALSKMEGLSVLEKGYYAEALSSLPQDTHGHGTEMASVISALGKNGVKGLASSVGVQVLPIKVENIENGIKGMAHNERLGSIMLFNTIKRAVNTGADVINLSLSGFYFFGKDVTEEQKARNKMLLCDPMIGYALYRAIERGVVVVMAAGHAGRAVWNPTKKDYDYFPDSVEENLDNKFWNGTAAVTPACWGRYYKGAIAVGALDATNSQIASFSNWGKGSIEMLAPGTGIKSYSVNGEIKNGQGTSYSTALVSAAVALTIAKHKKNGWKYSPWLIEDVLLNGTPQVPSLATGTKSIFKGRSLNLKSLADYIKGLEAKSPAEREKEPTENPEEGLEFKAPIREGDYEYLTDFKVYTKNIIASNKGRIQLQALAHFNTGSFKVLSSEVAWATSDPTKLKVEGGIAYPVEKAAGIVTVTGTYRGRTASTPLALYDGDVVTGARDYEQISGIEVEIVDWKPNQKFQEGAEIPIDASWFQQSADKVPYSRLKLFAIYNTGLKRDVTQEASLYTSSKDLRASTGGIWFVKSVYGGSQHELGALYKGRTLNVKLKVPQWELKEPLTWNISTPRQPGKTTGFSVGDVYFQIYYKGGHALYAEKIELVNSKNVAIPLTTPSYVSLMSLQPDTYFVRLQAEHRGSTPNIKRTYTSHSFTVVSNEPVKAEFTVPLKVCPLGSTYLHELKYTWADGTESPSHSFGPHFARIKRVDTDLYKNSGGTGAHLLIGDELKGKRVTVEGWVDQYPNVVASFECDVENTPAYSYNSYKNLVRPTFPRSYPAQAKNKAPHAACATESAMIGDGTPDDPFIVCSFDHLKEVMSMDNQKMHDTFRVKNIPIHDAGVLAKLGNHLDLSSATREDFPITQSSLVHYLVLDGDSYEMHGLSIVDKEFDLSFGEGGRDLQLIKNLNIRDFFVAGKTFKFLRARNMENINLKNFILQMESDVHLLYAGNSWQRDSTNAARSIHMEDINVVQGSGRVDLLTTGSLASKISMNRLKLDCAVKYACYMSRAISTGGQLLESGVWEAESSFYNFGTLVETDVVAQSTFSKIKIRSRNSSVISFGEDNTSGLMFGGGYFADISLEKRKSYYPNERHGTNQIKRGIAYGNYIETDLEGEASAGAFAEQSGLIESNHVKGTIKSNNCAGGLVGEALKFTRMVSNRVEATVVENSKGYGSLIGCLHTPKFNGTDQYMSPLFENNVVSMPMIGKTQIGSIQVDAPQNGQALLIK